MISVRCNRESEILLCNTRLEVLRDWTTTLDTYHVVQNVPVVYSDYIIKDNCDNNVSFKCFVHKVKRSYHSSSSEGDS